MEKQLVMKTLIISALLTMSTLPFQAQDTLVTDPEEKEDGSWVGVRGNVVEVSEGRFTLDHGDGRIPVILEGKNIGEEEPTFIDGEQVVVYGLVDDGFFKGTRINARAVFVESQSRYTYLTDGFNTFVQIAIPGFTSGSVVQGHVTDVADGHITIDDGDDSIRIDTSSLQEDPAAEGEKAVGEGDLISAIGNMDRNFWTGRILKAQSLYKHGNTEAPEEYHAGPEME